MKNKTAAAMMVNSAQSGKSNEEGALHFKVKAILSCDVTSIKVRRAHRIKDHPTRWLGPFVFKVGKCHLRTGGITLQGHMARGRDDQPQCWCSEPRENPPSR